jgi:hypothetical protein
VPDPSAAIAELATILDESHEADGVDGLLLAVGALAHLAILNDLRVGVHYTNMMGFGSPIYAYKKAMSVF